jgi:hypothetical protein
MTIEIVMKLLKEKFVVLPILMVLALVSYCCYYYYDTDYVISSVKYKRFTITSKCKAITSGTIAPYITMYLGTTEIVTAMVDSGYDIPRDCMESSIDHIVVNEKDNKLQIYLKNGERKELNIIGTNIGLY